MEDQIDELEVRIILKSKAKNEQDRELFNIFIEMNEYFPIKPLELNKMLIKKAYEHWFKKEIKRE